jgi:hypothetical protein
MVDPLVLTLRSLQSSANNQKSIAQATWDTINQAGQEHGAPDIDYDRFAARWETDPVLKQLVARFDGQGVVIKTKQPEDTPMQGTPPKPGEVSKMAKRATAKAIG